MASSIHTNRFPGESPSYREARNQLLQAEMTLRKNIEEVATLRRKLPLGGEVPEDYIFDEGAPDVTERSGQDFHEVLSDDLDVFVAVLEAVARLFHGLIRVAVTGEHPLL